MQQIPKLSLGTWLMGGTKDSDPDNDDAKDIAVIKTAIESGVVCIDTAQNYASGKCEQLVGRAIVGLPRADIQILTKQNRLKLSYDEVIQGCHESLGRLGVEYLDYFVCHAPNPDFVLSDFFRACNQLHKDGLIRNIGVSNFGIKSLRIALDASELPITLNQVSFSINDSDILTSGVYEFCLEHGIPIQAYRPLVDIKKNSDSYELLQKIAGELGLTAHQILIAYLHSFEGVCFTIRASTSDHWRQIQDALRITLEQSVVEALRQVHMTRKGSFGHFLDM